jgi:hypothetical protein
MVIVQGLLKMMTFTCAEMVMRQSWEVLYEETL